MSRTVFCVHLRKQALGLSHSVYTGELGQKIFDNISKQVWDNWQKKQIMLINEHRLSMINPMHRQQLEQAMVNYLFNKTEPNIKDIDLC